MDPLNARTVDDLYVLLRRLQLEGAAPKKPISGMRKRELVAELRGLRGRGVRVDSPPERARPAVRDPYLLDFKKVQNLRNTARNLRVGRANRMERQQLVDAIAAAAAKPLSAYLGRKVRGRLTPVRTRAQVRCANNARHRRASFRKLNMESERLRRADERYERYVDALLRSPWGVRHLAPIDED